MNFCIESPVVIVGWFALGTKRNGVGETQCLERRIINMTTHVSECSGSVIETLPPLTRVIISFDEISEGCGSNPSIPVQPFGHGIFPAWFGIGITPSLVAERMGFLDFSDHPVVDDLYSRPILSGRVDLNTHLGHQLVFLRVFGQSTRFCNVVGQWFLAINVQAHLHCGHSHAGMHMVGSRSFTQSRFDPSFSSISRQSPYTFAILKRC